MPSSFQEDETEDDIIQIRHEGEAVIATLLIPEVTMFTLAEMRQSLNEAVEDEPDLLVLDVSKTSYLDSSAVAVIFKLRHQIDAYGGRFCIAGMTGRLLNVMEKILKKDDVAFYESVEKALAEEGD